MFIGLKYFSNSKMLFFNCLFLYLDVSDDLSLYIVEKIVLNIFEKKLLSFLKEH